jgi:hypothetical protein
LAGTPLALQRDPSPLTPDAGGLEPINYHRLVKPVLESTCIPCHRSKSDAGPIGSAYQDLEEYVFWFDGGGNGNIVHAIVGGSRTIPGYFGAHYSKMGKALLSSHRDRVSEEEFQRVCLWLDAHSNELGAYHDTVVQRSGELVWPWLEVDPNDLQAVEKDRPLPNPRDGTFAWNRALAGRQGNEQRNIRITLVADRVGVTSRAPGRTVVRLLDSRGRVVVIRTAAANQSRAYLDISTLPSGVYLVQAATGAESVVRRVHRW